MPALSKTISIYCKRFFTCPKITATHKYRPHLPAKFESNGAHYFQDSTVLDLQGCVDLYRNKLGGNEKSYFSVKYIALVWDRMSSKNIINTRTKLFNINFCVCRYMYPLTAGWLYCANTQLKDYIKVLFICCN